MCKRTENFKVSFFERIFEILCEQGKIVILGTADDAHWKISIIVESYHTQRQREFD